MDELAEGMRSDLSSLGLLSRLHLTYSLKFTYS